MEGPTAALRARVQTATNPDNIKQEIDAGRPLCARIGWSGGGGHFVAIDGYNHVLDMVAVDDPWYGASDVAFSTFQTAYQGSGSWTSYLLGTRMKGGDI